ncbi:transporter substrate-binding domain-containing protein [Pseudodesulfovibrio sp. JC047]|uniref:substrate-binding periplasmic protein n=1 Tax=Pseudodesulfovibrio sp. JC047 TaxID=2683199 RepID=UPI0013D73B33|nr:transporter substrate-binding domain-containing protein [Pseudodesulfovibrio sp. JC047]NDV19502.1 transporter substrate-binding domain-containing protein [Pseudodesulfovibrio sp. JC047]
MHIDYPEYWPFFTHKTGGGVEGIFGDIITEALSRMGIGTIWHEYPWGRCQMNVKCGQATAMVSVPTEERMTYTVTHKHPFYVKELTVFTYADHPKMAEIEAITSLDDILKNDLSVVTYVGNGWSDVYFESQGITTHQTPQLKNVWRMLANKRADIAVEWPGAAWAHIIDGKVSGSIVQTKVVLTSMPFHLLLRKGCVYCDRLDEFDAVIQQMKQEGVIDKIVRRYAQLAPETCILDE